MDDRPFPVDKFDEIPLDNENTQMGSVHSFTRKNRGRRSQIIDEEAKRIDDEFWKNNSLFSGQQNDSIEEEEPNNQLQELSNQPESENEDNNGVSENGIDEEDEDDEDDEDYEGGTISSDDDNCLDSEEEEAKSNKDKGIEEENKDNTKPVEEEEEDEAFKLYLKNREKHFFFRPIFFKADIETVEKQDFSYVVLPEDMTLASGKNENIIAKQCVNRRYIGVPPKASEEFRLPIHYPTNYNTELFKCEDERYSLDLNIQRYKVVIKKLEEVVATQDPGQRQQKLTKVLASNKMAKQKYELDETQDELEKLRNVTNEISHDLENLYKRRAHVDITTKRKKEILYPLAVHENEVRYASNEKQLLGNSKVVNEISRNFQNIPLKKITASASEGMVDFKTLFRTYQTIFFENDLHKALFKEQEFYETFNKFIQGMFVSYRASPYSILPSNIFYVENREILTQVVQLILFCVKRFSYVDSENLLVKLTSIIETFFDLDLENQPKVFDVDSLQFQETLEGLVNYKNFKAEEFYPQNVKTRQKSTAETTDLPTPQEFFLNRDMNPPFDEDFKLFLPPATIAHVEHERVNGKIYYGTHFSYFIIRYIYLIYLKLLLVYKAKQTPGDVFSEQSQYTLDLFMNIIAAHALEKIDTQRYELSILNLFGSTGKYLFNIKILLQLISKAMLSLMSDDLSHSLFEKLLTKVAQEESEQELFTFACELINSTDEIQDTQNFVYRFHLDPSKGWFSTSIFDVKGVFMRLIKTQDKSLAHREQAHKNSPKKIQINRKPNATLEEVTEKISVQVQDTLLVKRSQQEYAAGHIQEEGDPEPIKKVHLA